MDLSAILAQVTMLSIEERIELVQAIWDSIPAEQAPVDLSEAQKHELDRRIAKLNANPGNILTWEQIKMQVRGRR
jgi:putative addiction module component (TIGR02574 family)